MNEQLNLTPELEAIRAIAGWLRAEGDLATAVEVAVHHGAIMGRNPEIIQTARNLMSEDAADVVEQRTALLDVVRGLELNGTLFEI